MPVESAIEAEITELEEVKNQLSKLSKGEPINWGNYSRCFPKKKALSPIVEDLNRVIQDLKSMNNSR
jgi:hypothetical protein